MRSTLKIGTRRWGIASLELVLVFPFLLAIVSALFLIGRAGVVRVQTATVARQQTWRARAQANPGQCLSLVHKPEDSEVARQIQQAVPAGPPFTNQNWQAQSGNALIANPWASQAIPFPSLSQNLKPHTTVLSLLGTSASGVAFDGLPFLIDPNTNPTLVAASGTGQAENIAVLAEGFYLEVTLGWPFSAAQETLNVMWNALNDVTLGFAGHTKEGKKIQEALNKLLDILNCFGNLYEAAQGHLGGDPYDN